MPGDDQHQLWQRFALDPRDPAHRDLRAADRDRDLVREVLSQAYVDGRLDHDDLEERSSRVDATTTLGALSALLDDLVPAAGSSPELQQEARVRAEAERRYLKQRRDALGFFVLPSLVCWIVYLSVLLVGGTLFPWPLFVTLGTGWGWAQLALQRQAKIAELEAQVVKEERKRELKQRRKDKRRRGR